MSTFEPAVQIVLSQEGVLSNEKGDPGGLTKYGITLKTFQYAQKVFPQKFAHAELKNITVSDATFIYEKLFWNIYPYSQIDNQSIANKFFSLGINMGIHAASLCLQRAINSIKANEVLEDGQIGQQTIDAANACDPNALLKAFRSQAASEYRKIVLADPSLQPDLDGLLKRAYS